MDSTEQNVNQQENTVDSENNINLSKQPGPDLTKHDTSSEQNNFSQQNVYQQQQGQYQQQYQYQQQPQQNMYQQNQYQQQPYNSDIVTPDKLTLEPAIACLLSVFVAGLGQMINGQIEKGLIILLGGMAIIFVVTLVTCGIGALLSPVLIAFSAIDAYKCAQRLQNGQCLGKYEFHIFD